MTKRFADLQPTETQADLVAAAWSLSQFAKEVIGRNEELNPIVHMICKNPPESMLGEDGPGIALGVNPVLGLTAVAVPVQQLFTEDMDGLKAHVLRLLFREANALAYAMATEAWALLTPPGDGTLDERGNLLRPIRDDDRRVSCLFISGETKAGDVFSGMWRISEGDHRSVDLDAPEFLELFSRSESDLEVGGRLASLLE